MGKRSASNFEMNTFAIWRLSFAICHRHRRRRYSAGSVSDRELMETPNTEQPVANAPGAVSTMMKSLRPFSSAVVTAWLLPSVVTAQERPVDAAIAASPRRITLEEAKQQAINASVNSPGARLAQLAAEAARYHRKAAQADYFPKVNAGFANLH